MTYFRPIQDLDDDTIIYCPGLPGFGDLYRRSDAAFVRRIHFVKYLWGLLCLSAFFMIGGDVYLVIVLAVLYAAGEGGLRALMRTKRIGRTPKPTKADIREFRANLYPRWLNVTMLGLGGLMTAASFIATGIAVVKRDFNSVAMCVAGIIFSGFCTWLAWKMVKWNRDSRSSAEQSD